MTVNQPTQRERELEKRERELLDLGEWLGEKMRFHKQASYNRVKNRQVNQGEIYDCHLGYNIGEEKNKKRPVVVISNNRVNATGKIVVVPITDAIGKVNVRTRLPQQNTWYLVHTQSTNSKDWYHPNRTLPNSAIQYSCLRKDSVIQCEEPRSLSKARLGDTKKGDLDPVDLARLKTKISRAFDI